MNDQNPGTIADTAEQVSKVLKGENVSASEEEREETGRDSTIGDGAQQAAQHAETKSKADQTKEEQPRRGDEPVANLE